MDKLPPELLSKILLYLPPMDRLSCSLTCRRLARMMTSSQLLDDIWLDIAGREMKAAASVLVYSQRQYTKLLLDEVDFSVISPKFWKRIGANLRVLELVKCSFSFHDLCSVLRQCAKLESLKLVFDTDSVDTSWVPEEACDEELHDSLTHLRHLYLHIGLTADILDFLLRLMPNVTSIFLSPWFVTSSDFLQRLRSILEKHRIVRTGADLRGMGIHSWEIIKFVEATSGSLEDLRFDIEGELTERACEAIAKCTRLRRLTLCCTRLRCFPRWSYGFPLNASHLAKLVSNFKNLDFLELYDFKNLADEAMKHVFELEKLHTLIVGDPNGTGVTIETLCGLREMSTLVKLNLSAFDVDSRVLRSLGSLANLRSLLLSDCTDSECFSAICENLKRLTELDLGRVRNLTDFDGMKLCRFRELRSLKFSDGLGFSDLTFKRGVGSRAMKTLSIRGCSLTDVGLVSIATHHDHLLELNLHDCGNITDAGVMTLLRNEPRLKKFAVRACGSVRAEMVRAMENICPRLR